MIFDKISVLFSFYCNWKWQVQLLSIYLSGQFIFSIIPEYMDILFSKNYKVSIKSDNFKTNELYILVQIKVNVK